MTPSDRARRLIASTLILPPRARLWPKHPGAVLAGFELNTEVKVVRWPDRYMDPRGVEMWDRVCKLTAAV